MNARHTHLHLSNVWGLAAVLGVVLPGCRDQGTPTAPGVKALAASVTPADPAGRHLVVFTAERVPAAFADRIAQLGGTIEAAGTRSAVKTTR